jgi:hypothetical protein
MKKIQALVSRPNAMLLKLDEMNQLAWGWFFVRLFGFTDDLLVNVTFRVSARFCGYLGRPSRISLS